MKYKIILLLFLLSSINIYSQKKYFFDYIIEYKFQANQTSKVEKRYLLTNSKDDTYDCLVYEEDKLNFAMNFRDRNGTHSVSIIDKNDFFKAETISLLCESIHYLMVKEKYDGSMFDIINKRDTLINGIYHQNYTMKYHKTANSRKYNRGISNYIIENNTEFHLPLLVFSGSFDSRENGKNIPNGIVKESYTMSYNSKKYLFVYKLIQFVKINKYLIIPENCNTGKPLGPRLIIK
ncbi:MULTISPECIES: hypothetical protein [unclassified Flavobacterium]|jgi:hypothetical protein|uniref:hypothetical protein n=1 Tax=unclassified Flavobacterium TaxID=196869 RepID=UPI000C1A09F7|nr:MULTISPECIES: hypothetical protein [unclassified Flavobacterium]PIF63449.1 hypothetical protein CLV00_3153 [Flavobacterium sp. 11]WKL44687.1 hypothetical protein Q1W72_03445 [Flavobacterium sp. ZE23DGlu08]